MVMWMTEKGLKKKEL